jgi:hypothetical protein
MCIESDGVVANFNARQHPPVALVAPTALEVNQQLRAY